MDNNNQQTVSGGGAGAVFGALLLFVVLAMMVLYLLGNKHGFPTIKDRLFGPTIPCPDNENAINKDDRYTYANGTCTLAQKVTFVPSTDPSCKSGWNMVPNTTTSGQWSNDKWPKTCNPRGNFYNFTTTTAETCPEGTTQKYTYGGKKWCNISDCPDGWEKKEIFGWTHCAKRDGLGENIGEKMAALTCSRAGQFSQLAGRCYKPCPNSSFTFSEGGQTNGVCTRPKDVLDHERCLDSSELIGNRCYKPCEPRGFDADGNQCIDSRPKTKRHNWYKKIGIPSFFTKWI
jgi:hypothetical protein